ncbi:MAG: RNase H1/viroplasmin domain-containing protein, partial [Lachnospiraceae bacterium]|nr:RNase H1/viroplasmin domain-containing protein [Lachnospiraceae bacterium]
MAKKFYAVKKGKVPGVYDTWAECKSMVDGFSGAIYKSFLTLEEAKQFV